MGLRLGIPLPGPFYWSTRVRAPRGLGKAIGWMAVLPFLLTWWCLLVLYAFTALAVRGSVALYHLYRTRRAR